MKIYTSALIVLLLFTTIQNKTASSEPIPKIEDYSTSSEFLKSDACQKNQLMLNYCHSIVSEYYNNKLETLRKRLPDSKVTRKAHSAWLRFRDAECSRFAANSHGGSIYDLLIEECKKLLTRRRIVVFEAELNCKKDGGCVYPE
jgi:uncharacterized protein YecT (DUF1311 family)